MKKKITLLAIFISIGLTSICQVNMDSLWNVWNDPSQFDTTRLKAMHAIAWDGYLYSQPDSAFYFAQLEYDFALSRGLKDHVANALYNMGASFYVKGDYARTIDYITRSLAIKEEIGDKKEIASCLSFIGIVYYLQGNYASAIDYYTHSLTISEELGSKLLIAIGLNNIALIYQEQGDFANAIDYYTRSLDYNKEIENKDGIAANLNNIGFIYEEMGDNVSAFDYYARSLTIREEIGNKFGIAMTYKNIGSIYRNQGDSAYSAGNTALSADKYASALDYYNRSLTIREEIGDKKGIAASLNDIGIIYKNQGDYTNAIAYSSRALITAQEVGIARETRDAASALYKAYKSTGRNKSALEMYELYIVTRDSIDSEKNQKEIIRQKYKYDYDKQALADSVSYAQAQVVQEAKLEKSRILQYALIGGLTLLLAFLTYVYNRFRVTQKQKLIITEQNKELATATELAESANSELQTKSKELEKFNNVMLDREMRIIELKKEANKMAESNNNVLPYPEVGDE